MNWYWNILGIENNGWKRLWIILNITLIIGSIVLGYNETIEYYKKWKEIFWVVKSMSYYIIITVVVVNSLMIIINWVIKGFKKG